MCVTPVDEHTVEVCARKTWRKRGALFGIKSFLVIS